MFTFFVIVLNGIIEGLTEFIPVSSTGHLILLEHFFPLPIQASASFQIAIQLGAILAAALYYRQDIKGLLVKRQSLLNFLIAMLPASISAVLAYDFIKTQLFSPIYVCAALIIGALFMYAADSFHNKQQANELTTDLAAVTKKQAVIIGLFQILSLWPGMSRSGSCIVGGIFSKLNYKTAADFSFILGIPIIAAAVCFDLLQSSEQLSGDAIKVILLGGFVSFITAYAAISTFIRLLKQWTLAPFASYRIVLAATLLWVIMLS